MSRLTNHQCAVLTAFTGILIGRMSDFQKYADQLLGYPTLTHEFASHEIWARLKDLSREDMMAMMPEGLMAELVEKAR